MITKHSFLATLVIALLLCAGASADVYLSTTGNNANDGLSAGMPKLTLSAALGVFNTQGAPTTLHIAAGTYMENGVFNVTPVGTAVNAVIVQGEGGTVTLQQSVLNVQGAYTQVKSISFDEQLLHEACVVVRSTAANCTINTCAFTGVLEGTEHFNTDTNDTSEPIDVAPVQVMAANQVTVSACTFNSNGQTWEYAILLPSTTGGAQDLLVSGCTINGGTTGTGGVKVLRACFNLQVLNTNFVNMARESVSLETNASAINSGTSVGVLVQGCNVDYCNIVDSQRGAIELFRSQVQDFTVRNVVTTRVAFGGVDGVKIVSATVANVLIENFTFNWPTGGSTGGTAISVTNYQLLPVDDGPLRLCYVNGLTIRGCNVPTGGGLVQFWNWPVVINTLIENCVTSRPIGRAGRNCIDIYNGSYTDGLVVRNCNLSWPGGSDVLAIYNTNVLTKNVTYDGNTVYAYNNGFVSADAPISNVTIKNSNIRTRNWHAIHFFRAGNVVDNVHISNCQLVGTGAATAPSGIVFADGPATHVDIRNCRINGLFNSIMFWYNITVRDLTVANCNLWAGTGDLTWGGNITSRVGNVSIRGATFDGLRIRGYRGFGFYDYVVGASRENITIRNCDVVVERNAFYSSVGNPQQSTLIEDSTFIAIRPATTTLDAQGWRISATNNPSVLSGWTVNRCYIAGTDIGVNVEGGSLINTFNVSNTIFQASDWHGFMLEQGSRIENATFNNCQFICDAGINDTTEKRPAGWLMEDPNSTMAKIGFHNCTFKGGQSALALQRWQIQLGAGSEPIVRDVLFDHCTARDARERGVSLHYLKGSNLVFDHLTIQNIPTGGIGVYTDFNGSLLRFVGLTFNGGGVARGMRFGSSSNFVSSGWSVVDSQLTNLAGIGFRIQPSVQNGTLANVTLSGVAGSSHGIFVDNQLSSYSGAAFAQGWNIRNCGVSGFGGDGIRATGSSHVIRDCTVTGAGATGLSLPDDSNLRPANASVQCGSNTITDCAGAGLLVEGANHTVNYNKLLRNGEGVRVRSGLSGFLTAETSTTGNLVTRNRIFGGVPASATGLWEPLNPSFGGDPGPNSNNYVNNTVTDFTQGSEFRGYSNRVQNNIFAYNANSGLRVLPQGTAGLRAGWNCAGVNGVKNFDGVYIDYTKDIWYTPDFVSRDPASVDFYKLTPISGCRDRGTTNGLVADGVTDLGAIESGPSEVASWRLY